MTAMTAEGRAMAAMDSARAMVMAVVTAVAGAMTMATAIDALRATTLANVIAVVVTKTVAAIADARVMVAAMAVLRATALVMRVVTVGAMFTVMAAVHLVTQRRLRCWQCSNEVNKDNNKNLTTT